MKSLANAIIGATMILVLLLAVALPIISSMDESSMERVYSENDLGDGYKVAKGTTYSGTFEFDGTKVTSGGSTVEDGFVIVSDTFYMVVDTNMKIEAQGTGAEVRLFNCNTADDTVTISGSTWTIEWTNGENVTETVTGTFSWVYYPDDSGTYFKATAPVYVDGSSTIVSFGHTAAEGRAVMTGTINSGFTTAMTMYTIRDAAANATATDTGSYTLESVTFTSGSSSITNTANLIVPVEYTSGFEKGIVNSLVGIIPVILVAALVVGVAIRAVTKRMDD